MAYIRIPFAESGDREAVPETTPDTSVSQTTGYTAAYAADPLTDPTARRIEREEFNGLIHALATEIQQYQQFGVADFITTAENAGAPFPYSRDALVRYEDPPATIRVYRSLVDNNTELPTVTANWTPIDSGLTAGTAATLLSLLLTTADPVDLVDNGNALNIGTATPGSSAHLAMSSNQLQAKVGNASGVALNINPLGGNVNLGAQSGTGLVTVFVSGNQVLNVEAAGSVAIRGDQDTDTDERLLVFRQLDGTARGHVGHPSTATFQIRNFVNGGNVDIVGTDAGGTLTTLLTGNPDGVLTGYHDGAIAWQTRDDGIMIRGSVDLPIGSAQDSYVLLQTSGGTIIGFMGFNTGDPHLSLRSVNNGGRLDLYANDAGGVQRTVFSGNPGGTAGLFFAGTETARTATAANGGLEANNTSTGGGFERVLTTSDLATAGQSQLFAKSTAQNVNNSTTLVADTDLTTSITQTGTYIVEFGIRVTQAVSAAGIRVAVRATLGTAVGVGGGTTTAASQVHLGSGDPPVSSDVFDTTGATNSMLTITATIDVQAQPQTVGLYWAQSVATVGNTTANIGSWMRVTRTGDT